MRWAWSGSRRFRPPPAAHTSAPVRRSSRAAASTAPRDAAIFRAAGALHAPGRRGRLEQQGQGFRLALDIGAAPAGDYAEAHHQPIDPRSSVSEALVNAYPFGIVVNSEGRRFMDEAPANPLLFLEEHCRTINRQPGGIGYFSYDAASDDTPAWMRMVRSDIAPIHADTIGDLAERIGVPRATFEAEVATYNAACGTGTFRYGRDDAAAEAAYREGTIASSLGGFDGLATQGLDRPNRIGRELSRSGRSVASRSSPRSPSRSAASR